MSAEIIFIAAIPAIIGAGSAAAVPVAVAGAGSAVAALCSSGARAAVSAANKLQSDYQDACRKMVERQEQRRMAFDSLVAGSEAASRELNQLVSISLEGVTGDPRIAQLQAGIERLNEQLAGIGSPPDELATAITGFATEVRRPDADTSRMFRRLHELFRLVAQEQKNQTFRVADGEVAELEAMFSSPLFESGAGERERGRYRQALAELQALPDSARQAKQSALRELVNRVSMKLDELAAAQDRAVAQMDQVAACSSQALAWIEALEQVALMPEAKLIAGQLRRELARVLTMADTDSMLIQLEAVLSQAKAQAQAVRQRLLEEAMRSELKETIRQMMLQEGYSVADLDLDASDETDEFVVRTSADAGTLFTVTGDGTTCCEFVSFRELDLPEAEELEQQHCEVVKRLMDQMAQENIAVEFQSRRVVSSGHPVPRIDMPESDALPRRTGQKKYLPEIE